MLHGTSKPLVGRKRSTLHLICWRLPAFLFHSALQTGPEDGLLGTVLRSAWNPTPWRIVELLMVRIAAGMPDALAGRRWCWRYLPSGAAPQRPHKTPGGLSPPCCRSIGGRIHRHRGNRCSASGQGESHWQGARQENRADPPQISPSPSTESW
jgi:hypothetical protein